MAWPTSVRRPRSSDLLCSNPCQCPHVGQVLRREVHGRRMGILSRGYSVLRTASMNQNKTLHVDAVSLRTPGHRACHGLLEGHEGRSWAGRQRPLTYLRAVPVLSGGSGDRRVDPKHSSWELNASSALRASVNRGMERRTSSSNRSLGERAIDAVTSSERHEPISGLLEMQHL